MKKKMFSGIIMAVCAFCTISIYAQNERIDFSVKNVALKDALKKIESQSDYTFFYSDSKIDMARKVSLDAKNEKISVILDQLLTECTYKVDGRKIIILPVSMAQDVQKIVTPFKVSGIVKDESGNIIRGAAVIIQGTTTGTITDTNGKFIVTIPENATPTLEISYIGYDKKILDIKPDITELIVVLKKSKG